MENPHINHQNSDSFSKKKLSLTSPVYKDLDFGQPNHSNKTSNKKTNYDHHIDSSAYPYNEAQYQMNYIPTYNNYHQHHQKTFVNHADSHNQQNVNREKGFYNSNEKSHKTNQNVSKNKDKKKSNNKEGIPSVVPNKQNTIKKEQSQPQVESSEPVKKKKKSKKEKEKQIEEFNDNPWAQPLKKALKKALAGPVSISNTKANLLQKFKTEVKKDLPEEETKKDEQEKKKFKFLRVRDIRSKYYANKAYKPIDRVNQIRARDIREKQKKKKLSKVKKAKLRYLELQILNAKRAQQQENIKSRKQEAEDGYETVDEELEKERVLRTKRKNKKEEDEAKSSGEEEEELKEKREAPEDKKIDLSRYFKAIPELEIPEEKRPQITYKNLKVRGWVDHILCEELDSLAFDLLNDLLRMQTIKKLIKPSKSKKRILCGMREVMRSINTPLADQAARCIVIAVNIQENPLQQGGDAKMLEIIVKARMKQIPIIHACSRKQLGQACTGNDYARIGVVSVTNYFGADDMYKDLLQLVEEKRKEFQDQINSNQ